MKEVKVSVAITTYNGESSIKRQLLSIINQSRPPDEIVISDDQSTDSTLAVIEGVSIASPIKFVIIINPYRFGVTQNFASTLSRCSGDIVILSDQDDEWHYHKIKSTLAEMSNKTVDLIVHDLMVVDAKGRMLEGSALSCLREAGVDDKNYCPGCAMAVTKDLISLALPIPAEVKTHDRWLNDIAILIGKREICSRVLGHYYRHEKNVSSGFDLVRLNFSARTSRFLEVLKRPRLMTRYLYLIRLAQRAREISADPRYRINSDVLDRINTEAHDLELRLSDKSLWLRMRMRGAGRAKSILTLVKDFVIPPI
jgi:glycosyltransferase involved in cell wall biosynthesis